MRSRADGRPRAEVADRRAREVDDATRPRVAGLGERERAGEVGVDRDDSQPGKAVGQFAGRPLERLARDVDRQIGSRLPELLEQQPRLEPAAAAELDQLAILADGLGHLVGVRVAGSPARCASDNTRRARRSRRRARSRARRRSTCTGFLSGAGSGRGSRRCRNCSRHVIVSSWREIVALDGVMRLSPVGFR